MHYVQKADCLGHQQELDQSANKLCETKQSKTEVKILPPYAYLSAGCTWPPVYQINAMLARDCW